jgi:hypothetical protein
MNVRTNRQILDWLLAEDAGDFPPAPPEVLADWVETIPSGAHKLRARRSLERRFGLNSAPSTPRGPERFWTWLKLPFEPPVYSTDDATGERLLLSPDFVAEFSLLATGPQKVYEMPPGLPSEEIVKWVLAKPPYNDREAYAVWRDWEGREYEMVNGKLIPKPHDGAG